MEQTNSENNLPAEKITPRGLRLGHKLILLALLIGIALPLMTWVIVQQYRLGIEVALVGCLTVSVMLMAWLLRGINRQLASISLLVRELEQGNKGARAEILSGDELGQLAASFNATLDSNRELAHSGEERDRMQKSITKLLAEVAGVAEGDLTREAEVSAEMTGAIADAFNFMITELRKIIGEVQRVTDSVTVSAGDTRAAVQQLARNSEEQALQIARTSSQLEMMTTSIHQVSENAAVSAQVAQQSLHIAQKGTRSMQNTIQGMSRIRDQVRETAKCIKRLGESSQEISEIVRLIDEIADRTSILALNASIQASRAGEAGQGFAVVAEEIERLAERSSQSTARIAGLVRAIQIGTSEAISAMEESTREVVEGSTLALEAGHSLTEIENVSAKLATLIQSIAAASTQQARSSAELARTMSQVARATELTSDGMKNSAGQVDELVKLADELRTSVASFKLPERDAVKSVSTSA